MLYLVGLGLSDETDITVKGLEVVKKASRVYLEAYTSILLVDQTVLVSVGVLPMFQRGAAYANGGRNHTMDGRLLWLTERWSSPTATRFCAMLKRKTLPS